MPADVAEHQRRRLEPRDPPQRRQVGSDREVAVTLLPARDLVSRHGIHLHLEREQVVAALDGTVGLGLVDEELGVQALAEQAPLHVGEGHDHRVEFAHRDEILELREGQHGGDPRGLMWARGACRGGHAPSSVVGSLLADTRRYR